MARVRPEVIIGETEALARIFVGRVEDMFAAAGRLSVALPGGSVAEVFCPALSTARIGWRHVDLFWCDERGVPPDHADSNYRIASDRLLSRIDTDPSRVHRMQADAPDLDHAARDYESELRSTLGTPPQLDVVLLGVGPDGHVCSLFPNHPALDEESRLVVPVEDSPKPPPRRLTLTLAALAGAVVVIAAFDSSKAAVVNAALDDPASRLPVALAVARAGASLFLLSEGVRSNLH